MIRKLKSCPWCPHLTILFLMTVNCLIWQLTAYQLGYKRYLLGIEWAAALIVMASGWRWLSALVFLLAFVLEVAIAAAAMLKLFNVEQLIGMAGFAWEANAQYQAGAVALLLIFAFMWWLLSKVSPKVGVRPLAHAVLAALLLQVGVSFAAGNFWRPLILSQEQLLVGSATLLAKEQLALNEAVYELRREDNMEYLPSKHSTAVQVVWGTSQPSSRKVLLVLAESWGLPLDHNLLERQLAPLRSLPERPNKQRSIEMGSIQAFGYTAMAEFRELCGRLPTKLNLKATTRDQVGECLPVKMLHSGYKVFSVHAANSSMYDRHAWYPALGLSNAFFADRIELKTERRCYSFPGLCDVDLFPLVEQLLDSDESVFVYWLSLNSHMPYDERDVVTEVGRECEEVWPSGYDEQICTYHLLQLQFFHGLAKLLASPAMADVEVLVVGDHAPPFNAHASRSSFVHGKVPFVHIQ